MVIGPDGTPLPPSEQQFSAGQQVATDQFKPCPRCGHWHPILAPCNQLPQMPPGEWERTIVDHVFQIAALVGQTQRLELLLAAVVKRIERLEDRSAEHETRITALEDAVTSNSSTEKQIENAVDHAARERQRRPPEREPGQTEERSKGEDGSPSIEKRVRK